MSKQINNRYNQLLATTEMVKPHRKEKTISCNPIDGQTGTSTSYSTGPGFEPRPYHLHPTWKTLSHEDSPIYNDASVTRMLCFTPQTAKSFGAG